MNTESCSIRTSRTLLCSVAVFIVLACPVMGDLDIDSLLVHSIGGPDALETAASLQSLHVHGSIDLNGLEGTFTSVFVPPVYYCLRADFGAFSFVQAYDGVTGWQTDHNGFASELSGEELKEVMRSIFFESYSYLFPDRIPGKSWYAGESELDDSLFHLLTFVIEPADTVAVFFEQHSGMPRRVVSRTDNIMSVALADDFRLVDNLALSFHVVTVAVDAPMRAELYIDSILLDAPVDMSIFHMNQDQPSDFRLPPGTDPVIIPFVYKSGHIFVAAGINGMRRVWFILDSGASANIFNEKAVADLGLEIVGNLPAQGVGGYEDVQLVRVDSVKIGDLCLIDQISGVLDMTRLGVSRPSGGDFGGVLGHDFLSRFPVLINYMDSTITIFNPDTFVPPPGGMEVPFRLVRNVPTIQAELDGLAGEYLVDLGNAIGLVIHPEFVDKHNLLESFRDVRKAEGSFGGIGGAVAGRKAFAGELRIGETAIESPEVVLPDMTGGVTASVDLAGNIGNPILGRFNVLFDYANQKVIFYRP